MAECLPDRVGRISWLGLVVSGGALVLALRQVQWSEAWTALAGVNGLLVASSLGVVIATTLAKAARWGGLLAPDRVPLGDLFSLFLVGQLANGLLPGRLGELVRAYLLGERWRLGKARVLGTILVEKFLDVVMLWGLLLGLLRSPGLWTGALPWAGRQGAFSPLPWFRSLVLPLGGIALSLLAVALFAGRGQGVLERVFTFLPSSGRQVLLQGMKGVRGLYGAGNLTRALAWSGLIWTLAAGTNYLLLRGFHLQRELPLLASLVILVAVHLGALFPTAPAQIGVFHYLCLLSLTPFGVERSVALSYAVVLHLIVYLPIATLGSWGLWRESFQVRRTLKVRRT